MKIRIERNHLEIEPVMKDMLTLVAVEKMQRVPSRQGHDCSLRVHAGRGAENARVGYKQILEAMNTSKGIDGALGLVFAHRAGGEEMDSHKAGQSVRQFSRQAF